MTFGENLQYYRKQNNLTQEDLAEQMQVSRQSVSKWENGEAMPDLENVIKLADILRVNLDDLCGRTIDVATEDSLKLPTELVSKDNKSPAVKFLGAVLIILAITVSGVCIPSGTGVARHGNHLILFLRTHHERTVRPSWHCHGH